MINKAKGSLGIKAQMKLTHQLQTKLRSHSLGISVSTCLHTPPILIFLPFFSYSGQSSRLELQTLNVGENFIMFVLYLC